MVSYVTMSSNWLKIVCGVHWVQEMNTFSDFEKITFLRAISLHFPAFWHKQTFAFSDVLYNTEYFILSISK